MMIRYGFLIGLLTSVLSATSSLTGISFFVDTKHKATIECADGIYCTLNSTIGIKNNYNMQRVFDSYMGFTKYKNTPKDSIVLELGHWGYAEHRYFQYEPDYKDLFLTKVEYFYDTMNMDGGETKVRKPQKVRANLDSSKVIISDKKILAELSRFLRQKLKGEVLFDTQKEYDLTEHNVEAYNNLAYYLNQEKVEGVEEMLLSIVKVFPQRAVAYYTLANYYGRREQRNKKKTAYMQYVFYMTADGKAKKIPKSVKDSLMSSVKLKYTTSAE